MVHTAGFASDQLCCVIWAQAVQRALNMYRISNVWNSYACPDAVLRPLLEERSWINSVSVIVVEECWPTRPKVHWSLCIWSLSLSKVRSSRRRRFFSFSTAVRPWSLWRGENFSWKQTSRSPSVFVFNWMLTEVWTVWDVAPWCL